MKATINVSLRIPVKDADKMQKEANRRGKALATFIREAALYVATERERVVEAK